MESPQDLPIAAEKKHPYVIFNKTVYLQTPIRQMRRENAAIFFEFKHIKPKKGNYTSTRCFCFMEMDEVKEGKIQLERCVAQFVWVHVWAAHASVCRMCGDIACLCRAAPHTTCLVLPRVSAAPHTHQLQEADGP